MLALLYKYLEELFLYYYYAKERKAIENQRKLEEYIRYFQRGEEEEEEAGARDLVAQSPPVEYNCIKNEGWENLTYEKSSQKLIISCHRCNHGPY